MSTKVGRYPSANSFGKGQCVAKVNGFYELGITSDNKVESIVSEVGETISNGIMQIELNGGHPAVAYENCWVDKHGYIFSRANVDQPMIELEPVIPEVELPEPEEPVLRPMPVNPYINLWKTDKFTITLLVQGTGTVLSCGTKDWLVVTENSVRFDNLTLPLNLHDGMTRITIDKHNSQVALTVNGFRLVERGQKVYIDRIGLNRLREPFQGYIQDVEFIDLNEERNNRFYSMRPELPEYMPKFGLDDEVKEEVEEEVIEEKPVMRFPVEPVLVSNMQFITSGMNPWVQLGEVHG